MRFEVLRCAVLALCLRCAAAGCLVVIVVVAGRKKKWVIKRNDQSRKLGKLPNRGLGLLKVQLFGRECFCLQRGFRAAFIESSE